MSPLELSNLVGTIPDIDQTISFDQVANNAVNSATDASFSSDISLFESSLEQAGSLEGAFDLSVNGSVNLSGESLEVARAVLEPFNALNVEAAELAEYAESAQANGESFTPAEIVTMTYKAQEFGFHSQLTANIANKLGDGVQQLFRQQG